MTDNKAFTPDTAVAEPNTARSSNASLKTDALPPAYNTAVESLKDLNSKYVAVISALIYIFSYSLGLHRANLTEKDQLEEADYNPFEHRDPNGASAGGALAHLLKSSLGTGILAMPMAFHNGGLLFGGIMTLIVGFLCTHCVHILVSNSY